ncbi:MAG TPA: ANTAR domain-containing protein [Nocardioides sp.]|nr:ANTAR domain-containing protein [Nocardioides sp.]
MTGRFSVDLTTHTWRWDHEVFRIHGLAPDSRQPTLRLMLDAAGDDAPRVEEAIDSMIATTAPFSLAYQLLGVDGIERTVVIVGERAVCDPDQVTLIEGYFIDLTTDLDAVTRKVVHDAVEASAEHRAIIEQAKGALMLVYGFGPDAAFSMLRWWSRNRNVKVRDLAEALMQASQDGEMTGAAFRGRVDRLLYDLTQPDLQQAKD